jgi:hypothetical protein
MYSTFHLTRKKIYMYFGGHESAWTSQKWGKIWVEKNIVDAIILFAVSGSRVYWESDSRSAGKEF